MCSISDYAAILALKNIDPYQQPSQQEYNNVITAWRQDILNKKTCWTANWKTDWKYFMKCNHSVYGICKSPKYHEYSKRERIVVFICCCSLFSIVSILSVVTQHQMEINNQSSTNIFITTNIINIVGSILIGISEEILKLLATCPCIQSKQEKVRLRMERIGHIFMAFWIIFGAISFVSGLYISIKWNLVFEYFIAILTNIIGFCIVPTLILTVLFTILWKREQSMDLNKIQFNLCYQDYLDWKEGVPFKRKNIIVLNEKSKIKDTNKATDNKIHPTNDKQEIKEP